MANAQYRYLEEKGFVGNSIPKVDIDNAINLYRTYKTAVDSRLIASSISPELGGVGAALAKKAISGMLGMEIDLNKLPKSEDLDRNDFLLFSETQSRFIVTIDPKRKEEFEEHEEEDFSFNIINGFYCLCNSYTCSR